MHDKEISCSWLILTRFRLRQAIVKWLHTEFKMFIAYSFVYSGFLFRLFGIKKEGLKLILKGRRVADIERANKIIRNILQQHAGNRTEFEKLLGIGLTRPIEDFKSRILILKLPIFKDNNLIEKGTIIVKFSETFAPMYLALNLRLLTKYFYIVLEPSSVGYSLPEILVWGNLGNEKIIVLSAYREDFKFLLDTNTNLVPIKLGPADWVDTSKFYKTTATKKIYDAIYVANFNPIKRVERYIRAVVNISRIRPNYKAALVLAGHGDAKREVLATLECSKKHTSIDVYFDLKQVEINDLFNKSKVNILISLREGSNKGLAEGLFSDTPALLIEESVSGNHLHINDQTGRVVPDSQLESALIWFSDHYTNFTSRDWAMKHISPVASTQILSRKVKELALSDGGQWSTDLFVKVNKPELNYLNEENSWLLAERSELLTQFSLGCNEENIINFLQRLQKQAVTNKT